MASWRRFVQPARAMVFSSIPWLCHRGSSGGNLQSLMRPLASHSARGRWVLRPNRRNLASSIQVSGPHPRVRRTRTGGLAAAVPQSFLSNRPRPARLHQGHVRRLRASRHARRLGIPETLKFLALRRTEPQEPPSHVPLRHDMKLPTLLPERMT